ncbi:hypothetical protein ABLW17_07475 [Anaerococcus murdochii]|uniref:hypothetical protein n=1 Tax=Anaerococcus murdochii TaxID=411577 RepID=UPI0032B43F9F
MKFEKCCQDRNTKKYHIYHMPRPKDWDKDVMDAIQMLLWYIPNIDSVQSFSDDLIRSKAFENLTFDYVLDSLGMSYKDVLFIRPGGEIFDEYWDYYQGEVCTSCQKIIIVRQKNKTKTEDLLRCIRNAVAHGDFTVVGDMFVGFNEHKGEKKAIIKIRPKNLIRALTNISIQSEYNKAKLIDANLRKNGFKTQVEPKIVDKETKRIYYLDILAEKNGLKYIVEIKDISYKTYLSVSEFQRILASIEKYRKALDDRNTKLVLVIDEARLTKDCWQIAEKYDDLIVLDLNRLIDMPDTVMDIFI